jgi:hypothetical protein
MYWINKIGLGLVLGVASPAFAQQSSDSLCLLTSINTMVGLSVLDIYDAYLSELPYTGLGLQVKNISRRFLNPENQTFSIRSDWKMDVGIALNQPATAAIAYMGGNGAFGVQYHLKPVNDFQLLIGGLCDAEVGVKSYSREVNNGGSLDLAANLNLAATLRYHVSVWNKLIRLQADFRIPLVGFMFVPELGESYMEIFDMGNYHGVFHFTSLHNKNGLNAAYTLQVPFNRMTLNLALCSDYCKYEANGLFFRRNITSIQMGATYDFYLFGGRKRKNPANFISTEW